MTSSEVVIRPLQVRDAAVAAEIHEESQPGTFLTSLGQRFLRLLYRELALSPTAFGYAALIEGQVVGMIMATEDTGSLFRDLIRRRWLALALVIGLRLLSRPGLIGRVLETLRYPSQLRSEPGEGEELLLGVRAACRQRGIGSLLTTTLLAEARRRGLKGLWYTVDARNERAIRFHQRHGAQFRREETLYGRKFLLYFCPLQEQSET